MKLKFVFRSLCVAAKREEKRSHSLAYARANGVIDVIAREWMRSDIGNANDDDRDKRKMKKIDCEIIQRARASERVASGDLWRKRTRSTRLTVDAACLFASLAFAAYWLTKIHTICNKLWIWSGKIEEETEHGEREREREWEGKKIAENSVHRIRIQVIPAANGFVIARKYLILFILFVYRLIVNKAIRSSAYLPEEAEPDTNCVHSVWTKHKTLYLYIFIEIVWGRVDSGAVEYG